MPSFNGIWTANQQFQAVGSSIWPSFPGAPTIGTATATSGTAASVAFTAPSSAGFPATITGYIVTSSPGGLTGTGASSPISVTGLTTGTTYTFTVRAINATGTGPSSAASNSVTPSDFIEDVFSTYLYTGNGSTQTITNGIDLSTYGGLVWLKDRTSGQNHALSDTARGVGSSKQLQSNSTGAATTDTFTGFTTSGFTLDASFGLGSQNLSTVKHCSWTFRKQPKFFDIVTYTGNGVDDRDIPHSLGSTPGCIIVKCTNSAHAWRVFHRSLTAGNNMELNATDGQFADTSIKSCTDTTFRTNSGSNSNGSGNTYVAYLFAHDAGGFGLTGTDNVISCGSFSGTDAGSLINLGYEPQFVLWKKINGAGGWFVADTMRGLTSNPPNNGQANTLYANTTGVEAGLQYYIGLDAQGFWEDGIGAGSTYIYIAIRRGPMKVPTLGTSVFQPIARAGTGVTTIVTGVGFPSDLIISRQYTDNNVAGFFNRLIGPSKYLATPGDVTLRTGTNSLLSFDMDGMTVGSDIGAPDYIINRGEGSYINYFLRRCPGVFDTVRDTGTGSTHTISHNLGVAPELIIRKETSPDNTTFIVYAGLATSFLLFGTAQASQTNSGYWNNTSPTSSVFTVGTNPDTNQSGDTFVSNLFATCPGVSKVGSYTGTGTTKQVDCGFTTGARFVLIKRTDSTGDWYVWDSARGIISDNDPYFLLNTTAAQVANTDYIDPHSAGFELSSTAPAAINASGGTYIFLAIA
jgi:hypothetical protein